MATPPQSATQLATPSVAACSHDAVIRIYDAAGNVLETHEHARDCKKWLGAEVIRTLSIRLISAELYAGSHSRHTGIGPFTFRN